MLVIYPVQKFSLQSTEYKTLTIGFGQYFSAGESIYFSNSAAKAIPSLFDKIWKLNNILLWLAF